MKRSSPVPAPAPKRILVVEAEPAVAKMIGMVLTIAGHKVEIAENGEKALARFKISQPDLVITSLELLEMDGLELAHAVRALSPAHPVILITGGLAAVQKSSVTLSVFNVVLGKPFSIGQLRDAVDRVFEFHG